MLIIFKVRLPGPQEHSWDIHTHLADSPAQRPYKYMPLEVLEIACYALYRIC